MKDFNQREYQTVILAALLHDIGKLIHRRSSGYEGKHHEASYDFIENNKGKLVNEKFYDIELVKLLILFHHSKRNAEVLESPLLKDISDKEGVLRLLKIVKDADSYSCAERDLKEQIRRDNKRRAPLDSIFTMINLDLKSDDEENICRYHLNPLEPLESFPFNFNLLTDDEIRNLINNFIDSFPILSEFQNFENIINVLLNLLEKYTWAVPSDTRYEFSDISLFDHLRSSAAIAACLYKRHIEDIDAGKRLKRKYEFVLIGGDFSGIQNYIFDITNRGSGGASKRLRARSFFITLFSEVTIHKILHSLNLPLVCNIFSAGGKFLLIAPNLDGIEEILKRVKHEVNKTIHDEYFAQFSFLMTWKDIKVYRDEMKIFDFFKLADEMFYQLEAEKARKSISVFQDNATGKWVLNPFKAEQLYKSYQGTSDCKICRKGPAIHTNPDTGLLESCNICQIDELLIGQELPKANYVAFSKGTFDADDKKILIFRPNEKNDNHKKEGYFVELLRKYKASDDYYLVYKIGEDKSQAGISIDKYYANYVPLDDNKQVLTFEDIAEKSKWKKDEKTYGIDLLGVLKADVDNLGLIFSKGFESPRRVEKGLPEIDRKTVSRFLTLSRMFELLFSGWMKEILSDDYKEEVIRELATMNEVEKESFEKYLKGDYIDFRNIYTVYSGGDDLVLVGPWETMIIFSIFLNQQFRKYTCQNKFITLSAGLTFVKPKYPIASAIKQADALLEKSKKEGKNRISLFGTTVEWKQLPKLINFFLFLNEKLNDDNSEIKSSFLYRLFKYHQMALSFIHENKIEGLKYLSALSYDIGRNIIKREKDGRITKGNDEFQKLQRLINDKPDHSALICNIKIPLFWAMYRNRRTSIVKEEDN